MCRLPPSFPRSVGFRPVSSPFWGLHTGAVERRPRQLRALALVVVTEQLGVDPLERTVTSPLLKSQMARRARAEVARQRLPLTAGLQAVHDASHHNAIGDSRSSAKRIVRLGWKQRGDPVPQIVWDVRELKL